MIEEVKKYFEAKQNLDDVSKGGKNYHSCSFMDISIRMDRLEEAKKKAIEALGSIKLKEIEEEATVSEWDCATNYTEPTKVLYHNKICIVEGIGVEPKEPKSE